MMKSQMQKQKERLDKLAMLSGEAPKVLDLSKEEFGNLLAEIFTADYLLSQENVQILTFSGCKFVMIEPSVAE